MKSLSESVQLFFLEKPERLTFVGSITSMLGAGLLLIGSLGQLATKSINILPTLAKQPEGVKSLADIYPSVPVWFVPESIAGFLLALAILIAGLVCLSIGKSLARFTKF